MELKQLTSGKPHSFEYRIIEVSGSCEHYKLGMTWQVKQYDFGHLCRHFYSVLFPYIKTGHEGVTITCGRDGGNSQFKLISNELL